MSFYFFEGHTIAPFAGTCVPKDTIYLSESLKVDEETLKTFTDKLTPVVKAPGTIGSTQFVIGMSKFISAFTCFVTFGLSLII